MEDGDHGFSNGGEGEDAIVVLTNANDFILDEVKLFLP